MFPSPIKYECNREIVNEYSQSTKPSSSKSSGEIYCLPWKNTAKENCCEKNQCDSNNDEDCKSVQNIEQIKSTKTRERKRKRNPELWKKNIRKLKKARGEEYISSLNKVIEKKEIRETCSQEKCRLKCTLKINDKDRLTIHSEFWSGNYSIDQKRQFICSSIDTVPIKRIRPRTGSREGKRTTTLNYFFTVNGVRTQVCQKYFINTLTISQTAISHALSKRRVSGFVEVDKRGRHEPHNKISNEIKDTIRAHIRKFPAVESHHSRGKSSKKYLGKHLNIARMYALYKKECEEKNLLERDIPKQWLYANIFNTEFDLSFKPPTFDTCDLCNSFFTQLNQAQPEEERIMLLCEYDEHLQETQTRYERRQKVKQNSSKNPSQIHK